jgi:hypothetical protein
MERVSPHWLVRDHGRASGDEENARAVLLRAPRARSARLSEAGVRSANLRADAGMVSASRSPEMLRAVASSRE